MYWLLSTALAQSIPSGLEAVPGEYLIKLKNSHSVQSLHTKVSGKLSLKGQLSKTGIYHLKLDNASDFQTLSHDSEVEYIEPNYILAKPNTSLSGADFKVLSDDEVRAMAGSTGFYQNYASVQVPASWAQQSSYDPANRPVVAIIDTGVDLDHPVFTQSQAYWVNQGEIPGNGIDDDFNGYVDDVYGWNFFANNNYPEDDEGHGSHVAGITVGAGLDIFDSPRDQSKIRIMALKFLDANGSGRTSDAIRALYYAVDNGAHVINCSWGGGGFSRSLLDALNYAYQRQVLVVTAAGNNSSDNDQNPMYPASYNVPGNIAVASATDTDSLSYFSNFGADSVHVAAPGSYIFSTYKEGAYAIMSGTSMAAPFVAGIAALSWREAPQLTGYQIKQLIMASVNPLSSMQNHVSTEGRVNAYNLTLMAQDSVSTQASQPSYSPDYSMRELASAESASGGAGGCGLVRALSSGKGGSGPGAAGAVAITFVLLLPYAVWLTYRLKASPVQRRRHDRFNVASEIRINLGGREITGQMKTLSVGGLSFDANDLIEKGSLVTMTIQNPTGQGEIEVQGRIVWSAEQRAYGVQFQGTSQSMVNRITNWTKSLAKAS